MEWRIETRPVDYLDAVAEQERRADAIRAGTADERVWLLEHPPIYTAGTSADAADLLAPDRFPVHQTGRGGQYTYHGPGQRVAYVQLDLQRRGRDVRDHVCRLERWMILTLARFAISAVGRPAPRVGVWVARPGPFEAEDKIAAIGVRVRRWVSLHGVALNVAPDLEHYAGIVPCGVTGHGVTSMAAWGARPTMDAVDTALRQTFPLAFDSNIACAA